MIFAAVISILGLTGEPVKHKIDKKMFDEVYYGFYVNCVPEAVEAGGSPEQSQVFCDCGATFYVKNMKAAIKKHKVVYQEDVSDYQAEIEPTTKQILACQKKIANIP